MKIILSRKGFDSEFGGGPSPIMPDGRLISLPIPSAEDEISYSLLNAGKGTYADLMKGLGYDGSTCHLDPDLNPAVLSRPPGWRPLFGQIEAAQGHLRNQGIGPGDLFLFFGWFRRTVAAEPIQFDPGDRLGRHVIFGYLEVDRAIPLEPGTGVPSWMEYHPHCLKTRRERANNVLYVATQQLSWNPALPGAGTLRFHDDLVLTAPGESRSRWRLPDYFRGLKISYHSERSWKFGYFQSAAKGQEFVVAESAAVTHWARALIEQHMLPGSVCPG